MILDFRTLQILVTFLSIISSFIMIIVWKINSKEHGPPYWAAASVIAVILNISAMVLVVKSNIPLNTIIKIIIPIYSLLLLQGILKNKNYGFSKKRIILETTIVIFIVIVNFLTMTSWKQSFIIHDLTHALILCLSGFFLIYKSKGIELVVLGFTSLFFFVQASVLFFRFVLINSNIPVDELVKHPVMTYIL